MKMKNIVQFLIVLASGYIFVRIGIIVGFMVRFYTDRKFVEVREMGLSGANWIFWSKMFASPWILFGVWGVIGLGVGWWIANRLIRTSPFR